MDLIFGYLEKMDNLPFVLRGIGTALLTILIPLAIAILMDYYHKRRSQEETVEFLHLDLHVILDNIFKIRKLIGYIFLVFVPTIFWEVSCGLFRFLELIVSSIGIYFMVRIIFNVYKWIKGNVFDYRFSYLRNLKNQKDMIIVWRSVWQTKNINYHTEKEFIKLFSLAVDRLLTSYEKS